jgi:hydrogenase nickel incorporation protein HypA/HybF
MHELTLANSLVELASDYAQRNAALRVSSITIRLGVLCGISRSLYFCFEPASRGTRCEGASLTIIESPLSVFCANCNEAKTPRALFNLRCPDCGRRTPKVLTGREMDLVSIEIKGALNLHASEESPAHEREVRSTMGTDL